MAVLLAFGSLLADLPVHARATLPDHELTWGVAMDNAVSLPGYKAYEDAAGGRPAVHVLFLDVAARAGASVEGALLEVAPDAWPALDLRERNYARTRVEVALADGRRRDAWTYVGLHTARARAREARRAGSAVVVRTYRDRVATARAAHGLTTPALPAGTRLADLVRRELP